MVLLLLFEFLFLELIVRGSVEMALAIGSILGLSGRDPESSERPHVIVIGIAVALLGAVVGVLTTWPLPGYVFEERSMRIAGLFFLPILAGLPAAALGRRVRSRGGRPVALATFAGGAGLAFAAAVVRFAILG